MVYFLPKPASLFTPTSSSCSYKCIQAPQKARQYYCLQRLNTSCSKTGKLFGKSLHLPAQMSDQIQCTIQHPEKTKPEHIKNYRVSWVSRDGFPQYTHVWYNLGTNRVQQQPEQFCKTQDENHSPRSPVPKLC